MFHVKIWLMVLFVGVITFHVVVMQSLFVDMVSQEQDRLRPVLAGQRFENQFRNYFQVVEAKAKTISNSNQLEKIVGKIRYNKNTMSRAADYIRAGSSLHTLLSNHVALKEKTEHFVVISREGNILFESRQAEPDVQKKIPNIPHVHDAFKKRSRTGIWSVRGKLSLVASSPIKNDENVVFAVVLYYSEIDPSLFKDIQNHSVKGFSEYKKKQWLKEQEEEKIVFFTALQTSKDVFRILPVAYSLEEGEKRKLLRGWFTKSSLPIVEAKYIEGMNRDLLKARIDRVPYSYYVGHLPADLSQGSLGFGLLKPIPLRFFDVTTQKESYFQSGGPRILSLVVFALVFLLAIWLSASRTFQFRRVLPRLQTAIQEGFPEISEQGLPTPWKKLVRSINKIFVLIQERGLGDQDLKKEVSFGYEESMSPGFKATQYFSEPSSLESDVPFGNQSDFNPAPLQPHFPQKKQEPAVSVGKTQEIKPKLTE